MATPITGVPKDSVGIVVQSFIDNDNVTHLGVLQRPDGTFDIIPEASAFMSTPMASPPLKGSAKKDKA